MPAAQGHREPVGLASAVQEPLADLAALARRRQDLAPGGLAGRSPEDLAGLALAVLVPQAAQGRGAQERAAQGQVAQAVEQVVLAGRAQAEQGRARVVRTGRRRCGRRAIRARSKSAEPQRLPPTPRIQTAIR